MRQELTRTFVGLIFALLFPAFAMADAGLTYHGRLLKPDGKPVTATNVQFQVQIRTPIPTSCLLFQETHVRNLSDTQGVFSLTLNDGAAVGNGEPFTLAEAFQNHGRLLNFPAGKCSGDNEYTPNPADGRQLFVSFNDGTFSGWEPLPAQNIAFIPLAVESMTVGGHRAGNFFRVEGASGPETLGAWSVANYGKLTSLIGNVTISGGNASIGGNAAGFTGSLSGDVTGGQLTTTVEKIQGRAVLDATPTNGQFLKWNDAQSRWEPGDVAVAG
ncbi:MAG TPA: hypothetical protein PL182_13265, partial [Pseudobdellovibrionaceae bacterium]|nr:hypothetical protein [Pseudobdellovibrionaceae bacterium]